MNDEATATTVSDTASAAAVLTAGALAQRGRELTLKAIKHAPEGTDQETIAALERASSLFGVAIGECDTAGTALFVAAVLSRLASGELETGAAIERGLDTLRTIVAEAGFVEDASAEEGEAELRYGGARCEVPRGEPA